MNTADRSIQLLDTALRRRFTFIEMMPNPEHGDVPRDVHGVNCTRMLKAINERIAVLLDREHQIGHTYLRQVYDLEEALPSIPQPDISAASGVFSSMTGRRFGRSWGTMPSLSNGHRVA